MFSLVLRLYQLGYVFGNSIDQQVHPQTGAPVSPVQFAQDMKVP